MKCVRSPRRPEKGSERGIALFMVISALGLLSVLIAELTYSTQMNARLAYNYVDNLKSYYLVKSAFKLSLVRLKAYNQVKKFMSDPAAKPLKDAMPPGAIEQIWSQPFVYPLPIPKEATIGEGDAIKDFLKESKLAGSFTAMITGQSSKLNINNLFIKTATSAAPAQQPGQSPNPNNAQKPQPQTPQGTQGAAPQSNPVDFREILEPTISGALEAKKSANQEFADTYRNVNGKDIVDAIQAYLFPDQPASNLPGFKMMKPKQAPFYSMSELHLIPGIDDGLYEVLDSVLTVYSTPGINVNLLTKQGLRALIPEITSDEEAQDILRKRDDPDVGKPWSSDSEFWGDVSKSPSVARSVKDIQARFQKANVTLVFEEQSFKINILANVGLATRRLEAYVIVDPKGGSKKDGPAPSPAGNPQLPGGNLQANPAATPPANLQDGSSAKKTTGLNLVYWRMF